MKLYINAVNYPDTALFSSQRPITRAEVVAILSQTLVGQHRTAWIDSPSIVRVNQALHQGTNTIEFSYSIIIPAFVKIRKIQVEIR